MHIIDFFSIEPPDEHQYKNWMKKKKKDLSFKRVDPVDPVPPF